MTTTEPRPLDAFQKRTLAARMAASIDAAWCDVPGIPGELGDRHAFVAAMAVAQEACEELRSEADTDAAAFLSKTAGFAYETAVDLIKAGDFDPDTGWTFRHEGVTHHLDHQMTHWRERVKTRLRCDDCGWEGDEGEQEPISNIWERMSPGDIFPWGDCPKCGAYVHEKREGGSE